MAHQEAAKKRKKSGKKKAGAVQGGGNEKPVNPFEMRTQRAKQPVLGASVRGHGRRWSNVVCFAPRHWSARPSACCCEYETTEFICDFLYSSLDAIETVAVEVWLFRVQVVS
jgi:hypothetical protein